MSRYVDEKICICCGECVGSCPVSVISMEGRNETALIEKEKCIDCGACEQVCPAGAIYMTFSM